MRKPLAVNEFELTLPAMMAPVKESMSNIWAYLAGYDGTGEREHEQHLSLPCRL